MATLGSKSVGSIVTLKISGVAKNFIVVHQGLPSSAYDSSCNGTWLLMEDIYVSSTFDGTNHDYENSTVHSYLNSTFLNKIESNIKNVVKQVKIPYRSGTGRSTSVKSGSNGLSTQVFLLSYAELVSSSYAPSIVEGAPLSYFSSMSASYYTERVAYLDGTATTWWTRTPYPDSNANQTYCVGDMGSLGSRAKVTVSKGVRPALILPSTLYVSSNGAISVNTAPTTPGTPSVPSEASVGDTITVSWSASSDTNGNMSGYELELAVNGGSWSQVYKGSNVSYSYTIPDGTETLVFRVRAYDTDNAYSSYATSTTVTVSSGAIIGYVTIGGVQRELTGEGYINVNGVLRELTDSKVNVGGTLKSLKG